VQTSFLKVLFIASRPKTLTASISPVLLGASLSWEKLSHLGAEISYLRFFGAFSLILLTSILIQVLTNFVNDLWDFKKGSDTKNRIGPPRVVQTGLITPEKMFFCIIFLTLIIILLGLSLVILGGMPILLIGLFSIAGAYFYTAGPYPMAHNGLGELFVLIFFGPVAVLGTEFLLTNSISADGLILGLGIGFLSSALLVINNARDIDEDRITAKRTLAARFGRTFANRELAIFTLIPYLILFFPFTINMNTYIPNLPFLIPFSILGVSASLFIIKNTYIASTPVQFNFLLPLLGAYLFSFSILLSLFILLF